MEATWDGHERAAWDALHRTAAGALQQDWAYGEALRALGIDCLRAWITHAEAPVALAQFLVRRVAGVMSVALCTDGPVWAPDCPPADRAAAIRALCASVPLRRPRALLCTPPIAADDATGLGAGWRVVTGRSTVRLDLTRPPPALRAAMHGKWRNRLSAAERSALRVQRVGPEPAQYRWLLERELAQRERRGYVALPDGFVEAWQAACLAAGRHDPVLTLRAELAGVTVAGMLFLVHGEAATYQVGWADDAGREAGAHNLLLWHAMRALRDRGVRVLDLGGVDTARGAGLARFKIGSGGEVLTFAGTYHL